ncbi:hypothetical protein VTN77DRAFT_7384 [Rasamsonia byssochlamydoides]|uniref:uncharacterized protein n=1 Tax=Rasamsonia byssochlamydoides TaxID=89139 RepID=UPI003741FDA3
MSMLIGKAVQGVTAGIGLVSEGVTARKACRSGEGPAAESSHQPAYNEDILHDNDDEREWELDQAQDENLQPLLYRNYPNPVVLPQRRPKDHSHGFIRAYAPDLAAFGIDQALFLNFLDTFNAASTASPWLNAINLASSGTMFLPHGIFISVSIAIQITTQIAIEVQGGRRR